MHNVVFIEYLESVNKLFEDEKCLFFRYYSIFSKHAFKCPSVAVLIDEIEIVGCFQHIDVLDNMLILFDICEDIDFVDCTFL